MAGHGSARPEDQANHPNRKVTRIAPQNTWFEKFEGSPRRGLTGSTLGSPAGPPTTFRGEASINKGGKMTRVSDQQYAAWHATKKQRGLGF